MASASSTSPSATTSSSASCSGPAPSSPGGSYGYGIGLTAADVAAVEVAAVLAAVPAVFAGADWAVPELAPLLKDMCGLNGLYPISCNTLDKDTELRDR
jgi:hypothetical protein